MIADFSPVAIQDLAERPLPPGGLWDPTYPPIPDPPPTPLHWNVCFSDPDERDRAADAIRAALPELSVESVDLPDEDWAARSQASLKAVHAGRFIVAPPWDLPAEGVDATVIVIEPSMGFGTGHHATTRMCLRLLSEIDVTDATVLDLGTGSGVLSMAAALMGARSVVGIDIDQDAIDSAETSARMNTLPDTITFQVLDFRNDPPKPAELVLANLTGGMLTSSATAIAALVRPGGQLILSGFDHTEVDRVLAAFDPFARTAATRRRQLDRRCTCKRVSVPHSTQFPRISPVPRTRTQMSTGPGIIFVDFELLSVLRTEFVERIGQLEHHPEADAFEKLAAICQPRIRRRPVQGPGDASPRSVCCSCFIFRTRAACVICVSPGRPAGKDPRPLFFYAPLSRNPGLPDAAGDERGADNRRDGATNTQGEPLRVSTCHPLHRMRAREIAHLTLVIEAAAGVETAIDRHHLARVGQAEQSISDQARRQQEPAQRSR